MNIVVDISPLKQKNLSGVGKYLYEVLSRLLVLDKSSEYFLISYGRQNRDIVVNLPQSKNIHYIHHNIPSKFLFILSFFNFPKLDNLKFKGKVVKVDFVWLANFNICNLKYQKTKLITTIHDLSFKIYPHFFNFKRKLWHLLVKPKKIIKRSNRLIAVSNNTSLDIQNIYNISKDKIIVMNLGVSKKYKIEDKDKLNALKLKYNLSKDFILFVGTKEPRKNILSLLKAFQKIKSDNLELVIVGGSGWKEKNWQNFYNNLNSDTKSRIKILDYCPEDDLPVLYNLAKIFIWPSFYEGFGLPVLEAMACGCPVITSNNSSLPDIVKDNALLVESFNVNSLFSAMNSLLKDEKFYNFYKSKRFNEDYYLNWDESAERLLKLFKKI